MGKAFPVSKCQAEHRYGDENSSNWSLDSQKMLFLPVIIAYTRHALAIPAAAGRLTSEWKASKNASAGKAYGLKCTGVHLGMWDGACEWPDINPVHSQFSAGNVYLWITFWKSRRKWFYKSQTLDLEGKIIIKRQLTLEIVIRYSVTYFLLTRHVTKVH